MTFRASHVRVANSAIVEHFITKEIIATRGHPEGWYVPIVYETLPKTDEFQYAHPTVRLMGNTAPDENGFFKDCYAMVTYEVADKPLPSLLQAAWGEKIRPTMTAVGQEPAAPEIIEVEPGLLRAIEIQINNYVKQLLNEFAKQRDYDSIESACNYKDSSNQDWALDALVAIEKRDQTWEAVIQLLVDIKAGQKPLIKSFADIRAVMPELVWPTNA